MQAWQQPVSTLFDPERSIEVAGRMLELAVAPLEKARWHGLEVLTRCTNEEGGGDKLAPVLLYRQLLDQLDGLTILVGAAAPAAARPQLRSIFEATMGLEYITTSSTPASQEQKCYAYLLRQFHERIAGLRKQDANTPEGQECRARRAKDAAGREITVPPPPKDLHQQIAKFEASVQGDPPWKEAEAAFQVACAAQRKRWPNWFSFYSGPRSVRALAEFLDRTLQYDFLYEPLSAVVHAHDFTTLVKGDGGGLAIAPLRDPASIRAMAENAITFWSAATRHVLQAVRPTEPGTALAGWYTGELLPLLERLRPGRTAEARAAANR
jgi:hypothetical protein